MPEAGLSTIERVCQVMDRPLRPLDYALILHFGRPPDGARLRLGALSARNLYPRTGSFIDGTEWRRLEVTGDGLAVRQAAGSPVEAIQEFMRVPFRLASEAPVRQLLVQHDAHRACLVTRVHHVAGDLLSTLMWVRHQLRVASGRDPCVVEAAPFGPLRLRRPPSRALRNPLAYRGRCEPIWTQAAKPSPERKWMAFRIEVSEFLGLSRDRDGFTYNDVLLTCALDAFHWWNSRHGAADRKVGVWVPMNIREEPFRGFGNGTSRIRVHRRFAEGGSFRAKCRQVRRQVDGSRRHGEWAVPEKHILTRLPFRLSTPLLRGYLNRPWADMGSAAVTHVEKWPGQMDAEFDDVCGIEVIGALDLRHALMIAAVTDRGATSVTLTCDPALLGVDDAGLIGERLEHLVLAAKRELRCAP